MSAPAYADFAARFPELATSVTASQTWIGAALTREWGRLDPDYWADERDEAAMLRVAHRFCLARAQMERADATARPIPTGAITSESAQEWSRSFSAPSNSFASSDQQDLARTTYGQEYLTLRDSRELSVSRVSM